MLYACYFFNRCDGWEQKISCAVRGNKLGKVQYFDRLFTLAHRDSERRIYFARTGTVGNQGILGVLRVWEYIKTAEIIGVDPVVQSLELAGKVST